MIELKVQSLTKNFGRKSVFTDLSFTSSVEVLGIAGANGSGKSTLLRTLSGLLKPTSGVIHWSINQKPVEKEHLQKHIGFSAPYVELYEELTVRENLEFVLTLRSLTDSHQIEHQLEKMDALEFSDQFYGSLSTGQKQRIKLAVAAIHQPQILFLDEPGSNLDRNGIGRVKEMVGEFRSKSAFVLIASNLNEELDLCDQIIQLTKED